MPNTHRHPPVDIAGTVEAKKMRRGWGRLPLGGLAFVLSIVAGSGHALEIEQRPLYAGADVPGNLALVPSVEFPTIDSQANIGEYSTGRRYSGYFDPAKCYQYVYSGTESERHFAPVSLAGSGYACPGENRWSGNYMNWATTQTIDPFRQALTGGNRVRDTATETWLQKARHDGQSAFADRTISNGGTVSNATGGSSNRWTSFKSRIFGLGYQMRFTRGDTFTPSDASKLVAYDPGQHKLGFGTNANDPGDRVYQVSVRVKVCDASVGLESNCVRYGQNAKPEGLIQEYSTRLRYSIFGYLNQTGNERNGGVMRSAQKFVGPQTHYPELGIQTNSNNEWDPVTGILVPNPDPAAATATGNGVQNSGVINYLNKFGQMTGEKPKGNDPVGELYNTALRYFRGMANISSYSDNLTVARVDGFPVIADWSQLDPVRYSCQVNAILGIGDVNTHEDRNLPTGAGNDDLSIAQAYTQKIFDLEGINKQANQVFTGRGNSAYMAGLAYWANTNDIRPDIDAQPNTHGRQRLSTYWVDVRENRLLEPKANNQYWLTAKYGGFKVPEGFDPLATTGLEQSWWHNSREYLVSGNNGDVTTAVNNYPRPDNFYVASEADKMVASLRQAFENLLDDMRGSGSSFASNTTKLEYGAKTFQAQFSTSENNEWSGELTAYDVDPDTGGLTLSWSASSQMPLWGPTNTGSGNGPTPRQIFYNNGGAMAPFQGSVAGLSSSLVNYVRGDRSGEVASGGSFRNRIGVLGDIVNSQPVYVGAPNSRLYIGKNFAGANTYAGFASRVASRDDVIYVGANDGMLHAFDVDTGREIFAFVPSAALGKLAAYAQPGYDHEYSVDGLMTVADVYINSTWKTILVGSMGRGGRALFALDVTNPASPELLWEVSNPALGNVLGQPIIAQVADGDWRVLVGNGPNSGAGTAQLIMIGVASGAVTTINTGVGGDNGLSGINAWSTAGNGIIDTVYAGDLKGNLWRLKDLAGSATSARLYAAGDSKPFTAAPLVAKDPATSETWVFVGSGRYLNTADQSSKAVQTWYGLIDRGNTISSGLREVSILAEGVVSGTKVRAIEEYTEAGDNGWYMDLVSPAGNGGAKGERMVVPNFFRGLSLVGTTRIPDATDVCNPGGTGFTMVIDPFTGGRLPTTVFDLNGDGVFDENDTLNGMPVSGYGYDSAPNNAHFLGNYMYTSLDDGTHKKVDTNLALNDIRRVSWRELIGD